jgi:hypothetical protein
MSHGEVVMYFCPMQTLQILEVVANGDGESIPMQAKVEGLSVPATYKPGFYNLRNVNVTSNGTMLVKATKETTWEFTGI